MHSLQKIANQLSNQAYIIAEAGSNHNGSFDTACELIRAGKACGADAVKFQLFLADHIVHPMFENFYQTFHKYAFPREWIGALKQLADEIGIDLLFTPFDEAAVDLIAAYDLPGIKMASGDLTYLQLMRKAALLNKPMIISTGSATLAQIEEAISEVRNAGNDQIILLQCTVKYPVQPEDVHLHVISQLKSTFQVPVGFSDHSLGDVASIGAVALGAKVVEKHFTLDRDSEGPDHPHSLNPEEMKKMVSQIRLLEQMLGNPDKKPLACELEGPNIRSRRSLYAAVDLKAGQRLSEADVAIVRQFKGLLPKDLRQMVGRTVMRDVPKGALLDWADVGTVEE